MRLEELFVHLDTMIKWRTSKRKPAYGCQCRIHHQAGCERDLFALDYQCARRRDLVYRVSRLELCAADSLCERARSSCSDGGGVGNTDRRATRLRNLLAHLLRSHGKKEPRAAALGLAALLRDRTSAGAGGRRVRLLFCCSTVGLLPPRQAALRFHGALQEEEWRSRACR